MMTQTTSPRWALNREHLHAFFAERSHRDVPAELLRAATSPIAKFTMFMGTFLLTLRSGLAIIGAYLPAVPSSFWATYGAVGLPGTALLCWGVLQRATATKLLATGAITPARITYVQRLPIWINGAA
jgi:hypothetical protein